MKNRYRLSLEVEPDKEPILVEDVKSHLRLTDDEAYLSTLISSARISAELYTKRSFINQTWNMYLDSWPSKTNSAFNIDWWDGVRQGPSNFRCIKSSFEIPKAPLVSVSSITLFNDDDSSQVLDPSLYQVSVYTGISPPRGRVTLRNGATIPFFDRISDGVKIQFVSGYGNEQSDVPRQIRNGILEEIAYRYENRGECGNEIKSTIARGLLQQYRLMEI